MPTRFCNSPWHTNEEGVSPGCTRPVMNTTFCSAPSRRLSVRKNGRRLLRRAGKAGTGSWYVGERGREWTGCFTFIS